MTHLEETTRPKTPAKAKVPMKAGPAAPPATIPAAPPVAEVSAIAPLICNHVMIRMATRQLGSCSMAS